MISQNLNYTRMLQLKNISFKKTLLTSLSALLLGLSSCGDVPGSYACQEGETRKTNTLNIGVCRPKIEKCKDGKYKLIQEETLPSEEICDGQDNDCDGTIDNNLTPPLNTKQEGVCAGSLKLCDGENGWTDNYNRIRTYESIEVSCDNLDNNCNGLTDENLEELRECGLGICAGGEQRRYCSQGIWSAWEECSTEKLAKEEICDNLDNNCNGLIDENLTLEQQCGVSDTGECSFGIEFKECLNGQYTNWHGCDAVFSTNEICDGKDNDCDGIIDNNLQIPSQSCYAGIGQCRREGLEFKVCLGEEGWSPDYQNCTAVAGQPEAEKCDDLDWDCDGNPYRGL